MSKIRYLKKIYIVFLIIILCFSWNMSFAESLKGDVEKFVNTYNSDNIGELSKESIEEWIEKLEAYDETLGTSPVGATAQNMKNKIAIILLELKERRDVLIQQEEEQRQEEQASSEETEDTLGTDTSGTKTIDETIKGAQDFISNADTTGTINESALQQNIGYIYNIFFACGMVVAVACGVFLGVKFMTSSVEGQAKVKELLIPYCVGCFIIFGAFGIWRIVINIMEAFN